jgi:hypothetical protein
MPSTSLDTADAVELAELLQFLDDWLATDHDQLSASLARFVGSQAYGVETLRDDLARFTFLLGGNDGEHLFLRRDARAQPRVHQSWTRGCPSHASTCGRDTSPPVPGEPKGPSNP